MLTYSKEYLLKISYKRMAWFLPKGGLVFFFWLVWRTTFQLCGSTGLITTILTVIIFDHIPPMSFQFLLLSDALIFQLCSTNSQEVCACVIMAVGTQSSNYLVIWDWVCTIHWPSIQSTYQAITCLASENQYLCFWWWTRNTNREFCASGPWM